MDKPTVLAAFVTGQVDNTWYIDNNYCETAAVTSWLDQKIKPKR